jgi:hypothetical protein
MRCAAAKTLALEEHAVHTVTAGPASPNRWLT